MMNIRDVHHTFMLAQYLDGRNLKALHISSPMCMQVGQRVLFSFNILCNTILLSPIALLSYSSSQNFHNRSKSSQWSVETTWHGNTTCTNTCLDNVTRAMSKAQMKRLHTQRMSNTWHGSKQQVESCNTQRCVYTTRFLATSWMPRSQKKHEKFRSRQSLSNSLVRLLHHEESPVKQPCDSMSNP